MYDVRIQKLLDVLQFFQKWEMEFDNSKDKTRYLLSWQTREDIDSSIYGFIEIVKLATEINVPIVPGYFNSDLIKVWFCQVHGKRNGCNQNPYPRQIGPAINSNLLTGSIVSKKGNAGGKGMKSCPVMPPTKKFKSNH